MVFRGGVSEEKRTGRGKESTLTTLGFDFDQFLNKINAQSAGVYAKLGYILKYINRKDCQRGTEESQGTESPF